MTQASRSSSESDSFGTSAGLDKDFDGQCVHVCEVGEDGWLNVMAGPVLHDDTELESAHFEYVSASPEGFSRRILIRTGSPNWSGIGRSRRHAKMTELLRVCRRLWGNDKDIDPSSFERSRKLIPASAFGAARVHVVRVIPDGCPRSGTILEDEFDDGSILGRHHVPELEAFLEAAFAHPDTLLASIRETDPDLFEERRGHFNDLLANGRHRHAARNAFRQHEWLMFFTEWINDAAFSCIRSETVEATMIASILSDTVENDEVSVSPRVVGWLDGWVAKNGLPNPAPKIDDLRLIEMQPDSWRPRDRGELAAFMTLSKSAIHLSAMDMDAAVKLMMPSKGRYVKLVERMQADIGPRRDLGEALRDIRDFILAAERDLVNPERGEPGFGLSGQRLFPIARKIITPDGGLRLLLSLSDRWHHAVRLRQETVVVDRDVFDHTWPRSVEDMSTSSGCDVVELLDRSALIEEGRTQGHCVGGYSKGCAFGGSHIFSIRSDGQALSTFEVVFDEEEGCDFEIVQHQGPNRREPDAVACDALAEWVEAVKSCDIPVVPRKVDEKRLRLERSARVMSIDEWRPFIVKPLARLDDAEFRAEISRLLMIDVEICKSTSR